LDEEAAAATAARGSHFQMIHFFHSLRKNFYCPALNAAKLFIAVIRISYSFSFLLISLSLHFAAAAKTRAASVRPIWRRKLYSCLRGRSRSLDPASTSSTATATAAATRIKLIRSWKR
jgi:hypothetical protein